MVFVLLFFSLLLPYLATGVHYSRNRYATLMAAASQTSKDLKKIASSKSIVENALRDKKEASSTNPVLIAKHHTMSCDKSRYSYIGVCNCGFVKKNSAVIQKARDFLEGKIDEPEVIKPMLLWPGYAMTSYLKSGTVKTLNAYNPDYTKSLEEALEIPEFDFKELR